MSRDIAIRRSRQAHSRKVRSRRGSVLLLVVMLLWVFFGFAAMVIDLGSARLAQRKMQSAADAGALEGLRLRDDAADIYQQLPPTTQSAIEALVGSNPSSPGWTDGARRVLASKIVTATFDGQHDPYTEQPLAGSGRVNLGAGPVVELTGGVGSDPSLAAGQLITIPGVSAPATYDPGVEQAGSVQPFAALQPNLANAAYGDMVAGQYGSTSADTAYAAESDQRGRQHGTWGEYPWSYYEEDQQYNRRDFEPAASDNSFLVRLRRLNPNDLNSNLENVAGVSTSGPGLRFLFATGSTILQATGDPEQAGSSSDSHALNYSPRQDGLTIRGTSIASVDAVCAGPIPYQAGMAVSVGLADPQQSLPGAAPFALQLSYWNQVATQTSSVKLSIGASGALTDSTTATPAGMTTTTPTAPLSVGEIVTQTAPSSSFTSTLQTGLAYYVPIVVSTSNSSGSGSGASSSSASGGLGIIGFGSVKVSAVSSTTLTLCASSTSTVAARNASATFVPGAELDPGTLDSAFTWPTTSTPVNGLLLAPALVSTVIAPQAQ